MRKDLLIIALGLFLAAGPAAADVLAIPEEDPAGQPSLQLPAKGSTMGEVQKKYGAPRAKQPTVGGNTPEHPPITRWDYDGFLVIFERDRVIDAVIPGAPPKLYHKDRLRPGTAAVAPPAPVSEPPAAETLAPMAPPLPAPLESAAEPATPVDPDGEPIPESAAALPPDPMLSDETVDESYGFDEDAEAPAEEEAFPADAEPDTPYPDRPTPAEAPAEDIP